MSEQTHDPIVALCQDCLRLHDVADLVPDDNDPPGLCPRCGGQTCNCLLCLDLAMDLMRGNFLPKAGRNFLSGGLQKPIAGWSLKDGVRPETSAGDTQPIDPARGDVNS